MVYKVLNTNSTSDVGSMVEIISEKSSFSDCWVKMDELENFSEELETAEGLTLDLVEDINWFDL